MVGPSSLSQPAVHFLGGFLLERIWLESVSKKILHQPYYYIQQPLFKNLEIICCKFHLAHCFELKEILSY